MILGSILLKASPKQRVTSVRPWPLPDDAEMVSSLMPWIDEHRARLKQRAVISGSLDDHRYHVYECTDDLFVFLITDDGEGDQIINSRIRRLGKSVRTQLKTQSIAKVFKGYTQMATPFLQSKLVVALVGTRGVGKTSTMHLLLGKKPPLTYTPTMGMNAETIDELQISNCTVDIWDLGGDDNVNQVWESCLTNADVILLLTDSTLKNVLESQQMTLDIMNCAETASLGVIANKQDLPNSLAPSVVSKVFNREVYPLVATDLTQHEEAELILKQSLDSHISLLALE